MTILYGISVYIVMHDIVSQGKSTAGSGTLSIAKLPETLTTL